MTTEVKHFFDDENWPENLLSHSQNYNNSASNALDELLLGGYLPLDIQEKIFQFILENNPDGELISLFFGKACTDPALLERIAMQASPEYSYLIVDNSNTSSMALKHILTDGYREQGVVADILDHPNCTSEIAMLIASDEDHWGDGEALDALSTCAALTDKDVMKLLDDWKNDVQGYYVLDLDNLIKNPNLSEETKSIIKNFELE
ncbi:MAG: hypothetical protein NT032_07720 [Actinobacteria bacterium]|nr:hypothetical protein [Actinomycetota bacterium]